LSTKVSLWASIWASTFSLSYTYSAKILRPSEFLIIFVSRACLGIVTNTFL
jgi:hypothetical protein